MKFGHIADLHLGSFRDKYLRDLNFNSFEICIKELIFEKVDFCIICGDIFDNPSPQIEIIEKFVEKIIELKNNGILVYLILGSHDIFNSQKSFLDVLKKADLFEVVSKIEKKDDSNFFLKKTKVKNLDVNLYGISARKKELDKKIYSKISIEDFEKDQFNIFMFHTSISNDEILKENILPKNFNYYAGGHIHKTFKADYGGGILSYPGPLFPNNFDEIKNIISSYNLCLFEKGELKVLNKKIENFEKEVIEVNCDNLDSFEIKEKINEILKSANVKNKLVLLEMVGTIKCKISDIEINKIVNEIYDRGANFVLRNTFKLKTKMFDKIINLEENDKVSIENEIINSSFEFDNEKKLVKDFLNLNFEKFEEERTADYEMRVLKIFKDNFINIEK